jgi:hypothetical protein
MYLSNLIYNLRPCLIHTCHAMPMPCSDHAVILKATAQHGRRDRYLEEAELPGSGLQAGNIMGALYHKL